MKKFLIAIFGFVCAAYCHTATAIPNGYTELEYIESTGTQYIDTGVAPSNNTGFIIDFQYTNTDTTEQIIIGSFDPNFLIDRAEGKLSYAYRTGQGLDELFPTSAESFIARHTMELNWKNNGKFVFEDITRNLPSISFINSRPIYIFSCSGLTYLNTKSGRVYSVKISNNSDVVRNMIPARRNSDGVVGMYDTVTDTFFENAGTGEFVAGPEFAIASSSYVAGMFEEINTNKQNNLSASNVNIVGNPNGFISSVTANDGVITVTKSEVTVPVQNSTTRMSIWLE